MSSNATLLRPGFRICLIAWAAVIATPLTAQDDTAATPPPVPESAPEPSPRINLMVTVPRAEANQAQLQQCRRDADAGTISGEIVVCSEAGAKGDSPLTGDRAATQKRYAEETMLKDGARAPDFIADCKDQGNPFGCVGFGKAPPPAYIVDFDALPKAPAGSDADRIARGLPPLNEDRELTEEEEKARREAAGIKTSGPPRTKKKGG